MTDARNGRADPGVSGSRLESPRPPGAAHPVRAFLRANPQLVVLLVICLVLGIGTFIAVLVSLVTAGSDQTTGEPSGTILGAHVTMTVVRGLVP